MKSSPTPTCQHVLSTGMYRARMCGRRSVDEMANGLSFCGLHHPAKKAERRARSLEQTRPQREAREARERLASAAPELLEAAATMIDCHDATARSGGEDRCGCDDCTPFRAIVAKAEAK